MGDGLVRRLLDDLLADDTIRSVLRFVIIMALIAGVMKLLELLG